MKLSSRSFSIFRETRQVTMEIWSVRDDIHTHIYLIKCTEYMKLICENGDLE